MVNRGNEERFSVQGDSSSCFGKCCTLARSRRSLEKEERNGDRIEPENRVEARRIGGRQFVASFDLSVIENTVHSHH